MIDVSEVIFDPDFAQFSSFKVLRQSGGGWVNGIYTPIINNILMDGIIIPQKLDMVGTDVQGSITGTGGSHNASQIASKIDIYTTAKLYTNQIKNPGVEDPGDNSHLSDEITWDKKQWKIVGVNPLNEFGYYHSVAVRKLGA